MSIPTGRELAYARLLRAARDAKGWSQTRLMAAADISKMDVYRFEAGANRPSASKALGLCAALDIPPAVMRAALDGDAETTDAYIRSLERG